MSEPPKMAAPTEGVETTFDQIQANWLLMSTLEETGGTFYIVSYELEMKAAGDADWVSLVGGSSNYQLLTHTETGLVMGTDYLFRVRAKNSFGWGPWSDEVTIRADEVPAQIVPVTTSIQTLYARIDWSPPSTDNGSAITSYRVLIQ